MRRPALSLYSLPLLFLAGRLFLLLSLPLEGLRGYGDLLHFYRMAGLGWPFLDYWIEFPPLFAFLSALLYRLAGGQQHVYDYLLVLALTLAQAGSLAIFLRLASRLHGDLQGWRRSLLYLVSLLGLAYGWWYFDPVAVFFMLLGLDALLSGKDSRAGFALALGALAKVFPLLALPVVWLHRPPRAALKVTLLSLGITALVYGSLWLASPDLTLASLRSQGSKGSWETPWALLDGNFNTGNFGPESERYDPATAGLLRGNPAVIPPALAVVPFALLGGLLFLRARAAAPLSPRPALAFFGLTWMLFLLWSPGWSPQWVMFLIPLVTLVLPEREALLMTLALALTSLLEWPVLLSRGFAWGLWLTVPLRTLLLVLLATEFWSCVRGAVPQPLELEKEPA